MSRPVSVNFEFVKQHLERQDYSSLENYLKTEFRLEKDKTGVPLK